MWHYFLKLYKHSTDIIPSEQAGSVSTYLSQVIRIELHCWTMTDTHPSVLFLPLHCSHIHGNGWKPKHQTGTGEWEKRQLWSIKLKSAIWERTLVPAEHLVLIHLYTLLAAFRVMDAFWLKDSFQTAKRHPLDRGLWFLLHLQYAGKNKYKVKLMTIVMLEKVIIIRRLCRHEGTTNRERHAINAAFQILFLSFWDTLSFQDSGLTWRTYTEVKTLLLIFHNVVTMFL